MNRMKPKRLAEIEGESVEFELVDALKAERKRVEELEAKLADRHERMNKLHKRNADLLDAWEDMDLTKELKSRIEAGLKLADDFGGNIGKRIKEVLS